jgi:hypothetical protein
VVHRLLEHVDAYGTKLAWGTGQTPGVGGWYDIGGRPTVSWALNLGSGSESSRTTLVLYFGAIVKYADPAHIEGLAAQLLTIPPMRDKILDARANDWDKWPSVSVAEFADNPSHVETLFAALTEFAANVQPPSPASTTIG